MRRKQLLTLAILVFGCLSFIACGGPQVATQTGQQAATKPKKGKKKKGEDLTRRAPIKERVIKYVEGVPKKAQDLFRQGMKAALTAPPNYKVSLKKFRQAIDKDQAFLEAYTNLGKVYEKMRDLDRAREVYQEALDKNGDKLETLQYRAFIGKLSLIHARRELERGNKTEADRLMQEGKDVLDNVLSRDVDNIAANNATALYWLERSDPNKAEEYVIRVLEREPQNTEALNTRGLINLERGKLKIAKWIFEQKVLSLDPNSPEAHTNLGVVYVRLGSLPAAVRSFKTALDLDPDNLPAHLNLASVQLNWLDYAGAAERYELVLTRQKDNIEAWIGLGSSQWGMMKFEDAIKSYNTALKFDSRRTPILLKIAKIYETHLDKIDDAILTLNKYLDITGEGTDSTVGKQVKILIDMKKMNVNMSDDDMDMDMDDDDSMDEEKPADTKDSTSEAPEKAEAPKEGEKKSPAKAGPAKAAPAKEAPAKKAPAKEAPPKETPGN
tara:strand:- start:4122 stop:5612 length:1491 start_codon:yes stop_codon:yes gene_type:complete